MKSSVIPQVRVEPELRAQLDAVLAENETLSEFVEDAVRRAVERRRVEASFHARGEAAWQAFARTGAAVSSDDVLGKMQARLEVRRQQLARK